MQSTASAPLSLVKKLILGSRGSGESVVVSPLDSLRFTDLRSFHPSVGAAAPVNHLTNREVGGTSRESPREQSAVAKAVSQVQSLVSQCLKCSNSGASADASTTSSSQEARPAHPNDSTSWEPATAREAYFPTQVISVTSPPLLLPLT